jgi:hypothetical protein
MSALDEWPNSGSLHLFKTVTFRILTELRAEGPRESWFDFGQGQTFGGAFAKLQKVMSVSPHAKLGSHWAGLY